MNTKVESPLFLHNRIPAGTGSLLGLSWLHFLNDGAANFLPGILPAVLLALHQNVAMAAAIMSALLIGQSMQPLMGWLADRQGGRTMILLGVAGTNIGVALVGWISQLWALFPVLFLIGLSNAAFHPQAMSGARTLARLRHGTVISVFMVGGELGRGLWPLLASLVVMHWGMASLWILALAALATVPFIVWVLPKQAPRHAMAPPIAWRRHWRPASLLVGYVSMRSLLLYSLITYLPILWHDRGGTLVGGAALVSVLLVVGVLGNLGGGMVADHFGRKLALVGSSSLVLLLVILCLLCSSWWIWPVLGLLGIAIYSAQPVTVLIGQDIFPENRGLGSGIALGVGNGLGALFLLAIGIAVTRFGVNSALWLLIVIAIISLFFATRVLAEMHITH
ncbi:MFS transporter [Acidithiobacillus ferrooxidans]|jgi:FSR family fosmidomycin resistance protein-like MFS transporter|uniref:MFS transporter n=1 Tax=Acidithiobacillus ferrooxidans TaxID=920 RepID=UPI000B0D893E|nr:MFS transporter [Acidithiobacillus ferrooxidans]MBU2858115.1 MFS transporter [Acidithiobacillus ferrooxidans]MBU2861729.1 MFS transporter [Acidithiobacillus ferrooxidans]MCL4527565.1 MFS transporter [Gammaproteobacteria bacterium]MCR2830363.1 MFS transporter [Acidithiobacillus ferrooxidans]